MNTFNSFDELWLDAAGQLLSYGHQVPSRDGYTREILGYCGRLADPRAGFMFNPVRKLSPSYAAAELIWYLSGQNDIEIVKAYAPQYTRFTEDGVHANGAYGWRWARNPGFLGEVSNVLSHGASSDCGTFVKQIGHFKRPLDQIRMALLTLMKHRDSRQCVVSMWDSGDLPHAYALDRKDLPCTLNMQFMVRADALYLTVTMRSNDIWMGMPYDVWAFTNIQRLVAEALGLGLGWYQHQAMSLHVYDRNEVKFTEAAGPPAFETGPLEYQQHDEPFNDAVHRAVQLERFQRLEIQGAAGSFGLVGENSLLGQTLLMSALKWDSRPDNVAERLCSPVMKKYILRNWCGGVS